MTKPAACRPGGARWKSLSILGWLSLVMVGCEHRPVAPELRNSPVYSNAREGFRFLVPDGFDMRHGNDFV